MIDERILSISATAEVATALNSAWERGLWFPDMEDLSALRFWRDEAGSLVATAATIDDPTRKRVEVEWERGVGYRAAD